MKPSTVFVGFISLLCVLVSDASCAEPGTHTVVIENMKFSPTTVTVIEGDVVTFINKDIVPHTVTDSAGSEFDSGFIESNKSWQFTVKSERNALPYYCRVHPDMKGEIKLSR